MQVDPVQERPGNFPAIPCDVAGRARTGAARITAEAARARVHRADEQESGRKRPRPGDARDGDHSVFERLAQRLEGVPPELGQLVEEEDSEMSERELPGARVGTAARERCRRSAVMGRAERALVQEPAARGKAARHAPDARDLEALLARERRKDSGQTSRQHRLARPGRAGEEDVVAPGGRELQCPARDRLTADVREVRPGSGGRPVDRRGRDARQGLAAEQVGDRRTEVRRGEHGEGRHGCRLLCVSHWHEQGTLLAARGFGEGENTGHGPELAVESKLPDERHVPESLGGQVAVGREDRERDGEVQSRAGFRKVGGREIHDDGSRRDRKADVAERRADALAAFLHGGVRQTDDREGGKARPDRRFHDDRAALEAGHRRGVRPGDGHARLQFTVTRESTRICPAWRVCGERMRVWRRISSTLRP